MTVGRALGLSDDTAEGTRGRGPWGAPVGISVHDFAQDADAARTEAEWSEWLNSLFS
ncbi:hypothetical protein ACIBUY_37130 [Streptomyces sp. NPDC050085]|uniref:hypothetical protein n=1 Tax=Streptomyces sp. NPDC050085 TaxID=3365600 RepID=UPI0037976792